MQGAWGCLARNGLQAQLDPQGQGDDMEAWRHSSCVHCTTNIQSAAANTLIVLTTLNSPVTFTHSETNKLAADWHCKGPQHKQEEQSHASHAFNKQSRTDCVGRQLHLQGVPAAHVRLTIDFTLTPPTPTKLAFGG